MAGSSSRARTVAIADSPSPPIASNTSRAPLSTPSPLGSTVTRAASDDETSRSSACSSRYWTTRTGKAAWPGTRNSWSGATRARNEVSDPVRSSSSIVAVDEVSFTAIPPSASSGPRGPPVVIEPAIGAPGDVLGEQADQLDLDGLPGLPRGQGNLEQKPR